MEEDPDQDPISSVLTSRRIPHGRSGKSHGGQKRGSKGTFDPHRAIGEYEVRHGSGINAGLSSPRGGTMPRLTIHQLTAEEDGLLASFDIDGISGTAVLAGSRKVLKSIADDLERADEHSIEDTNADSKPYDTMHPKRSDGNDTPDSHDEDANNTFASNELEVSDEKIRQRAKAFEKNSFRNPKFWLHWRGHVKCDDISIDEDNMGYIVFTGNDCSRFEGTITSKVKGWDNKKIKGFRVKSHVGPISIDWLDYDLPGDQ